MYKTWHFTPTPIMDRLVTNANKIESKGESMRQRKKK